MEETEVGAGGGGFGSGGRQEGSGSEESDRRGGNPDVALSLACSISEEFGSGDGSLESLSTTGSAITGSVDENVRRFTYSNRAGAWLGLKYPQLVVKLEENPPEQDVSLLPTYGESVYGPTRP